MKTFATYGTYKPIQKVGFWLIVIAGALTLAGMVNLLNAGHFVEEDLSNYVFLLGGVLVLLPSVSRGIKGKDVAKKSADFPAGDRR